MQVLKYYMKSDASDYGDGATLLRTTSRKRAHRTDSMQEAAELANDGDDDSADFEGRSTDGRTPSLPEGVSPGLILPQLTHLVLGGNCYQLWSALTTAVQCSFCCGSLSERCILCTDCLQKLPGMRLVYDFHCMEADPAFMLQ